MILITTYKVKPFLSNADTKALIEAFAKHGAGPGVTANYFASDGSHGVTIAETDDVAGVYRNLANYGQWMEFDTKVMLPIDEAVPLLIEALG